MKQSQSLINKGRLCVNGVVLDKDKAKEICGEISVWEFIPNSQGNAPLYENNDFAIFNKPSNVPSHPKGLYPHYTLLDEIYHFYSKEAALIHRLDTQTSGLILVGKHGESTRELGKIFMNHGIYKEYIAQVAVSHKAKKKTFMGKFCVNAGLLMGNKQEDLGIRVRVVPHWQELMGAKTALSEFEILRQCKEVAIIKAIPKTGRTHQLRAHLAYVGLPIIGDCLYGVSDSVARKFLSAKVARQELKLRSNRLRFRYKNTFFDFMLDEYGVYLI